MASADVKITMTTSQFQLMMEILEEAHEEDEEYLRKELTPGDKDFESAGQRVMALEALIRQLK